MIKLPLPNSYIISVYYFLFCVKWYTLNLNECKLYKYKNYKNT